MACSFLECFSFLYRPYVVLPEVNSNTLNPWIQPYSYATTRSKVYKNHAIEGVLSEPSLITTVSPSISSPQESLFVSEGLTTASPTEYSLWGQPTEKKHRNDTDIYQGEFLFPPERYKIVEENLLYEIRVGRFAVI